MIGVIIIWSPKEYFFTRLVFTGLFARMYGCIYKTISIYKAVFTGGIYKARYLQCYLPLTRLKTIILIRCQFTRNLLFGTEKIIRQGF